MVVLLSARVFFSKKHSLSKRYYFISFILSDKLKKIVKIMSNREVMEPEQIRYYRQIFEELDLIKRSEIPSSYGNSMDWPIREKFDVMLLD